VKTVTELVNLKNSFEEKIMQVTGYDDEISALEKQIKSTQEILNKKANELTIARKNAFGFIEKEILGDLVQLGMPKSKLEIKHESLPDFSVNGKDTISFLFSANNDMPLNEISKVASGGEMSRLMLAIKNLLRKSKTLPTVIFDEIDSGVSGEIALKMGNIIKSFSASAQIINITHLPQIAAKGEAHFVVYKYEENGKTLTSVKLLNAEERIEELAKMVGGNDYSEASLKIAREMVQN
jgi:DNA repair protein RecN (Recombination protein N)